MTEMSKEYAAALFALAEESGMEKEVLCGLALLIEVYEKTPALCAFLSSPAIAEETRISVLEQAFDDTLPAPVLSFFVLLVRRHHVSLLVQCAEEYERIYADRNRTAQALITSAVPLHEQEKERLRAALEHRSGKRVAMRYAIDDTLLGGVVVSLDGVIWDGSLRRRLQMIRDEVED